jgi:site-specific DNA-methyltransferase (adenine-specific)
MTAAPSPIDRNKVLIGDALDRLRELPDDSIDMVLTSPPYFRLRNYATEGQIGLEQQVDEWAERLASVSAEVQRVLVSSGTFWLNLGDSYSTHQSQGASRKSLLMAPERLALRLQGAGWIVRNKVVWAKTNPMPTSIKDRLSCTYELIYVFARQPTYFFDLDAIRQPHRSALAKPYTAMNRGTESWRGPNSDTATGLDALKAQGLVGHPLGKNPGDVWQLPSSSFRGAHHATFPVKLARRAIQAGCPEARCSRCRMPWRRRVIRAIGGTAMRASLAPTCDCQAASEAGLVLDPFIGSGTTAIAAEELSRDWLGIELNPDFASMAAQRIANAKVQRESESTRVLTPRRTWHDWRDRSSVSCGRPRKRATRLPTAQHRGGRNVRTGRGWYQRHQNAGNQAQTGCPRPAELYRSTAGGHHHRRDPDRHHRAHRPVERRSGSTESGRCSTRGNRA